MSLTAFTGGYNYNCCICNRMIYAVRDCSSTLKYIRITSAFKECNFLKVNNFQLASEKLGNSKNNYHLSWPANARDIMQISATGKS